MKTLYKKIIAIYVSIVLIFFQIPLSFALADQQDNGSISSNNSVSENVYEKQAVNLLTTSDNNNLSNGKMYFDFDKYDYSDPADYLNAQARAKKAYWESKYGTALDARVDNGVFPTDQDFFGVWDPNTGTFSKLGKINYDYTYRGNSFGLEQVLADVKAGNYAQAKNDLLTYHRNLITAQKYVSPQTATRIGDLTCTLLLHDFYVHTAGYPEDIFYAKNDWSTMNVNLLDGVKRALDADKQLMPIMIYGVDKDGYMAEFVSKDDPANPQYAPYIEAVVGGKTIKIPVKDDSYILGGSKNGDHSHGREPLLYSAESDNLENARKGILTDDNTRRTYMMFDLGPYVQKGDPITSATLKLYGKYVDRSGQNRYDSNYQKMMVVVSNPDTAWTEDTLSMSLVQQYTFSYAGNPSFYWGFPNPASNPGVRMGQENIRMGTWWGLMAQQYNATGNEDYARACILYLHDFIKQTFNIEGGEKNTMGEYMSPPNYGGGRSLFGSYCVSLDASTRGSALPKNLPYLYFSPYMTGEVFTTFLKYFWCMGTNSISNTWGSSELGNWGTQQMNAHYALKSFFPEVADEKIWDDAIWNHFLACSNNEVQSDNGSKEGSQSYTNYAVSQMLSMKGTADALNMVASYPDKGIEKITALAKYLVNCTGPGITDVQNGDGGTHLTSFKDTIKTIADWKKDPLLLWMTHDGEQGTAPNYTSYYYPITKMMTMRSGWGKNDLFLHTNADGAPGFHMHWDDFAIIAEAYGQYLLIDPLTNGTTTNDLGHRWLISSKAHNTVEINDYCQNSNNPTGTETCLPKTSTQIGSSFARTLFSDNYDFTKMDAGNDYKDAQYAWDPRFSEDPKDPNFPRPAKEPGMKFQRNILFVKPNFWIVSDYMDPYDKTKINKYSQYWHMDPSANMTIDGQFPADADHPVGSMDIDEDHPLESQIENTQFVPGTGTGAFMSNYDSSANIMVVPADISNVEPKISRGYVGSGGGALNFAPFGRFDKYVQGTTVMDTILFPTKQGESYSVVPTPIMINGLAGTATDNQGAASAFTANIKTVKGAVNEDYNFTYYILHKTSKRTGVTFGDYGTDGTMSYYEKSADGTPRRVIAQDATYVKNSRLDYSILKSKTRLNDIGVEWNNSEIDITTDPNQNVNLNDLNIYAPVKIEKVTLNGQSINEFKQDSNYLYFGELFNTGDNIIPISNPGNSSEVPKSGPRGGGNSNSTHSSGITTGNGNNGSSVVSIPTSAPKPSDAFESELKGHWAENELTYLIDANIIKGSNEGLQLKSKVSRAEFIAMLLRALNIQTTGYKNSFSDVNSQDWYADYIQAAVDNKILEGYDGKAMPEDSITREEAFTLIINALANKQLITKTNDALNFDDVNDISDWAKSCLSTAVSIGLLKGEDHKILPKDNTLREQAMVMIYRLIQYKQAK